VTAGRPPPRRTAARLAVPLLAFEGLGALWGGGSLLARPDGSLMQLSPALLRHTPFADYTVPGAVLLVVNGLLPLAAAALWLRRHPWAPALTALSGVLLFGWIACQIALIRTFMPPLHLGFLALGAALAVLGWRAARR